MTSPTEARDLEPPHQAGGRRDGRRPRCLRRRHWNRRDRRAASVPLPRRWLPPRWRWRRGWRRWTAGLPRCGARRRRRGWRGRGRRRRRRAPRRRGGNGRRALARGVSQERRSAKVTAGERHPRGFYDQHLGCGGSSRWVADRRAPTPSSGSLPPAMLVLVMERVPPWPPPRRALPTLDRVVERHDEGARFGDLRSGGAPTQRPRRGQLATRPRVRPGRAPTCVAEAMSLCTGSCRKRGARPAKLTQPRGEAGSKRHNLGFVSDEPPSLSRAVPTPPTRATEGAA